MEADPTSKTSYVSEIIISYIDQSQTYVINVV